MSVNIEETLHVGMVGRGRFELGGVSDQEIEILEGAFKAGHSWVRRGKEGGVEYTLSFKEIPKPADDLEMLPFWRPAQENETPVQLELFRHAGNKEYTQYSSASITIQALCGYHYTAEKYKIEAEKLESYGFACLRSRRGMDGQFWELWHLPGTWAAKGELRESIEQSCPNNKKFNEKLKTKAAINFLGRKVSFGSLDVSVQRLAQVIDPEW